MSSKFVIANHKMNMTSSDINKYLKEIKKNIKNENVIICPSNIYIPYFLKQKFGVGIQNIYYKNSGSYTGEISPRQAKSMEVDYVIVGHSERRQYFLETNNEINQKIKLCLKNELKVILCIGETNEEKRKSKTEEVLEKEIIEGLNGVDKLDNIIIAYEPIWAIGTNEIPSFKEIDIYIRFIKQIVKKYYNYKDIKVVYGGSVNKDNIGSISKIDSLDGVLVGGSSTRAEEFIYISEAVLNSNKIR